MRKISSSSPSVQSLKAIGNASTVADPSWISSLPGFLRPVGDPGKPATVLYDPKIGDGKELGTEL